MSTSTTNITVMNPSREQAELTTSQNTYEFSGTHFLANYTSCKHGTLTNIDELRKAMTKAVKSSGATILRMIDHVFENEANSDQPGYTSIYLLSESHATIHTYPEVNSCFIDIFTCGTKCSYAQFDQELRSYLEPGTVSQEVVKRDDNLQTLLRNTVTQCWS